MDEDIIILVVLFLLQFDTTFTAIQFFPSQQGISHKFTFFTTIFLSNNFLPASVSASIRSGMLCKLMIVIEFLELIIKFMGSEDLLHLRPQAASIDIGGIGDVLGLLLNFSTDHEYLSVKYFFYQESIIKSS